MAARSQITNIFKNVQRRVMSTAQLRLVDQLPAIMERIYSYAISHQRSFGFSDMTGNWINSFGVALYRDGHLVAVSNMSDQVDAPIRTTLVNDESFYRGTQRYDQKYQKKTFTVGNSPDRMGTRTNYFANEEVLNWLRHSWTRKEGFSFRIVSVTEYQRDAARRVLLQMSDEIDSYGGNIWQFNLG